MPTSIFKRKFDLLYLTFFLIHLPVMFCRLSLGLLAIAETQLTCPQGVDLAPMWPAAIKPEFLNTLRTYYTTTFRDQFFTEPPAWFNAYMWMELIYHVPLSLWAIGALLRGSSFSSGYTVIWHTNLFSR